VSIDYTLKSGSHESREAGMCAMEWVAYLANEPHSDSPVCVSPVLRSFCIAFNDALPDGQRQRLHPYLTRCIGTAGDGRDEERAWLASGAVQGRVGAVVRGVTLPAVSTRLENDIARRRAA
jgi:hypothetical protein